ncbi:MAG: biopolymer transporter ExbD [Campylobacterales bacterium]
MKGLKRVEGINVVPLIDVVLVLLAIVLTVSTFVAAGQIKLDLPQASNTEQMPPKSIEISIMPDGGIYFAGELVSKDAFEAKMATISKEDSVSIRGDKKSSFEDFVFVMDRLKGKGVEKISIVAKNDV